LDKKIFVYLILLKIREEQTDIIGLQEVRFDARTGRNQVSDLQKLLPEFQWAFFSAANNVSRKENMIHNGWEREGKENLIATYNVCRHFKCI
jgi:endonuclease/exonuclease/phosphatase family metal-dependent hydrolase